MGTSFTLAWLLGLVQTAFAEGPSMTKVFHFDAPREKYHCDAAILWCFDNRFELGFRKFLKRIGMIYSDPIKIAGGAKCLASPEHESDREFVLDQIRKSMRLHGTSRVILMLHSDCGAYGGLAEGFHDDSRAEAIHHEQELHRAAANLSDAIPGLKIQGYFVDFEGIWDAQITTRLCEPHNQTVA
jgi:carbonic anhydrase